VVHSKPYLDKNGVFVDLINIISEYGCQLLLANCVTFVFRQYPVRAAFRTIEQLHNLVISINLDVYESYVESKQIQSTV
jgi:hypothetical protein